jgi:DNA-binding NtrC family response regulator
MSPESEKEKSILIVEDEQYLSASIKELLEPHGHRIDIVSNASDAMGKVREVEPDLMILDLSLPPSYRVDEGIALFKECLKANLACKIIIMTGQGKLDDAIECIRSGAEDFLLKPVNPEVLNIVVERTLYKQTLERKVKELESTRHQEHPFSSIVGASEAMKNVYRGILYAASIDANVLITGETGTGKGLVARAIHEAGLRKTRPFLQVNCAALSSTLIESELFGHEEGAFTGAKDLKIGKFEYAQGGSLFLDEVAEIPLAVQVKLLNAVEEKKIQRVGGNREIETDVRIIAASNKDLERAVLKGSFRKDLFYRLNVLPIHIPPLRSRRKDIAPLVSFFVEKYSGRFEKPIDSVSPLAMETLVSHDWVGNVRELENVVVRAVVSAEKRVLSPEDFPDPSARPPEYQRDLETIEADRPEDYLDAVEREIALEYKDALIKSRGNKSKAAKSMGMSESTFRYRLKKYQKFFKKI